MRRSLITTLSSGALAAVVVVVLQKSGLLIRPETAILDWLFPGGAPNDGLGAENYLLISGLGLATAWTMLQVAELPRRIALLLLLLAEIAGAAFVLSLGGIVFQPLPGLLVALFATCFVAVAGITEFGRRRRAAAAVFRNRLAPAAITRLAESDLPDLSVPQMRDVTVVFCEIANQADLINELAPRDCASLANKFIAAASELFLRQGGYLHGVDGEGIHAIFGYPLAASQHAALASRAALLFRDRMAVLAYQQPDSLGKVDLRIGISSGAVVATVPDAEVSGDVVISGAPVEVARRLAMANKLYGSRVLLGPRAFSEAGAEIVARPLDFLRSSEAHERLEIYELLALTAEASAEEINCRDRFWTGLVYFRERRWKEAFAEFNRARRSDVALDEPLQWYLRRLEPLILQMSTEPTPVAADPLAPL